jgi:uncharacterized protein with PIN domain
MTLNQSSESNSSVSPILLADCMLGRLAKWLRLLGYDTAYDNGASDPELARRARAEGRGLKTLLIQSEVLEEQMQEVQNALGPPPGPALSRCSVCNIALEPLSPEEVADRVPSYVMRTQAEFHRCPGCGRIYWPGSHLEGMREQLERFNSGQATPL